mmetsp:Transcript_6081/g.14108  ORF Transcript_6081/g.14108 Transcript_6081/m.14108 type:complete len:598 (+) Transcript_6081:82-1875(+)|eukprot:CAMPEP_0206500644 /NCGR_PEP_ID=MMETSP0324_2-20121206/52703_1 /ASSEMBLY_ACC=CAM_ASM_000836 /TAXON_ID=2866 /ORGANISM="Crypthecodinium cohnii, Strain Seligo" /LENGTH=597 /DNA_ID=CAMNT_0053988043 /DNA_START=77 /DNA_END=1870 /DNA_ORIENTATION=-
MAGEQFLPISEISSYHTKWTICGRVTLKGPMRSFTRDGRTTSVFDVHLLDESQVEIRASFFGNMADTFYPKLEQGKCYTFSRGNIRVANRQYNRGCTHRYELVFDRDALIEETADKASIDTVKYSFVDLHAVGQKNMPCTVDLCAVIVSHKPATAFTSKEGKSLVKRELVLADDTCTSLVVAIWGERASQADAAFDGQPIVALKGVTLREWNGSINGSLMEAGAMDMEPKMPEADRLRKWWSADGKTATLTALSNTTGSRREGLLDLKTLGEKSLPCVADLCGVVVAFRPSHAFTSSAGKDLVRREITIGDQSGSSITVTLWGDRAKQDDKLFENSPIVKLEGVLVKEWQGGRSGSMLETGALNFNPEGPEAAAVQSWWKEGGSTAKLSQLSQQNPGLGRGAANAKSVDVEEMRKAAMAVGTEPEVFQIVCRLATVQTRKQGEPQPLYYMACQEPREGTTLFCNKRVSEDGYCAACNRQGKQAARLNIRCRVSDSTDSAWLTTFHEAAQGILKTTAEDIQALESGENGREALEAALRRKYFQEPMQVTVRAKLDTYNGESRPNVTCIDARPVNRAAHGRAMLKSINQMLQTTLAGGA